MATAQGDLILTSQSPELLGRALRFAVSATSNEAETAVQPFMSKQVYVQPTEEPDLYTSVWATDLTRMNIVLAHQTTYEQGYFDEHGALILDRHVVAMVSPILESTKGVGVEFRANPSGGYVLSTGGFGMDVPATTSKRKPYDLRRSITPEDIADSGTDAILDFKTVVSALRELGITSRASHTVTVRGQKSDQTLRFAYKRKTSSIEVTHIDRPFKFMVQAQHLLSVARELEEFGVAEGGLSLAKKTDKLARLWTTLHHHGPWFAMNFLWRTG